MFYAHTILLLFFDILKPLRMEKKGLKKANAVSYEELNKAQSIAFIREALDDGLKMILESDKYSDEQKKEMGQLYIKMFEEAVKKASGTDKDKADLPESRNEKLEEE